MALSSKLKRIALDSQGLLKTNTFGRGKQATLRAIEHIGYIQIDTISVVERAHHHVLWSRVDNYHPKLLEQLVAERHLFEYWSHAAAWLPMRDYRFALPRMAQIDGDRNWFKTFDKNLNRHVLERITAEGPLRARDFEDNRSTKQEWWDWKPAKQALEQLFMQGELMVTARQGFQKVYDLPERVLPDWVDTHHPSDEAFAEYLIDSTLRAHGFSTRDSMVYLRKGQPLRRMIDELLQARVEDGSLTTVQQASGHLFYIDPNRLESRTPRCQGIVKILSPFDNAVIQRQRGRDVFAYDYQIECYVPEKKRRFGYFCLPLLYRDNLVGRIDCKAHRSKGILEVKSLHLEAEVDEGFQSAFDLALASFATFNDCAEIDTICA